MITNWLFWVLVGIFSLGALAMIASVGEQRKPVTPGVAVAVVIIDVIIIILIFVGWPR